VELLLAQVFVTGRIGGDMGGLFWVVIIVYYMTLPIMARRIIYGR
jgi:hypothetical protein